MDKKIKIFDNELKDQPMVSICCQTFNHKNYIIQALESFLMQKVDFPIEILLRDDASTDGTAEICKDYANKYSDIIKLLAYEENQYQMGVSPFIDNVKRAKGKYIALCEGDDYWTDPLKLQKQVDFLEANTEYAGCAHQSTVLTKKLTINNFKENVPEEIKIGDLTGGRPFHTASVMFNRSVLDLLTLAPKNIYSRDRLLYFCIVITGKFHYINKSMCVYRLHESGASTIGNIDQLILDLNTIDFLKTVYPAFPKYKYMSYVYATIGLCKNGSLLRRFYYSLLSILFSFSYFPANIYQIFNYLKKRL